MDRILPLARREWLQHRFAWSMLVLVPLALAVLLILFASGQIQVGADTPPPDAVPSLVAFAVFVATPVVLMLVFWVAAAVMMAGLARRDHADRSIEFWLSLPVGHATSLVVPLVVHLVLVPLAALVAGALLAVPLAALLLGRVAGLGAWAGLPWGELVAAALAVDLRLVLGLPLATLWLLPLLLLVVLAGAVFRRWGFAIVAVGLGLGSIVLERLFGIGIVGEVVGLLFRRAGEALAGPGGMGVRVTDGMAPSSAFAAMREQALAGIGPTFAALATPAFAAVLLASTLLFLALVEWRRRGAGTAG